MSITVGIEARGRVNTWEREGSEPVEGSRQPYGEIWWTLATGKLSKALMCYRWV